MDICKSEATIQLACPEIAQNAARGLTPSLGGVAVQQLSECVLSAEAVDAIARCKDAATMRECIDGLVLSAGERIEGSALWPVATDDEKRGLVWLVEDYVYSKVHDLAFGLVEDPAKDEEMRGRIERLSFVMPAHLEIPESDWDNACWSEAIEMLLDVSRASSPRRKLTGVVGAARALIQSIEPEGDKGVGADCFLPHLIYVAIRANPASIVSNIAFIHEFLGEDADPEGVYYLTSLEAALEFIGNVDASQLRIDQELFDRLASNEEPRANASLPMQKRTAGKAYRVCGVDPSQRKLMRVLGVADPAALSSPKSALLAAPDDADDCEAAAGSGSAASTPTTGPRSPRGLAKTRSALDLLSPTLARLHLLHTRRPSSGSGSGNGSGGSSGAGKGAWPQRELVAELEKRLQKMKKDKAAGSSPSANCSAVNDMARLFDRHVLPQIRGLEPFKGSVYTAIEAPEGRDLAPGDALAWGTLAFASPSGTAVAGLCRTFASVPGARVVLLQWCATEGAWLLPAGPRGRSEGPREVVLEPGWAYDVLCTGTTLTGPAAWATLSQRRSSRPAIPAAAETPLAAATAASLDVALPVLCRMVDDDDVAAAAAAMPAVLGATAGDPLVLAARLLGAALSASFPLSFCCGRRGGSGAGVEEEVVKAPGELKRLAGHRLAEVSRWFPLSPTMAWLVGAWHLLIDRDLASAVPCLEASTALGSALGALELGLCLAEAEGALRDEGRAAVLFEVAAEAGSAEALVALGRALLRGAGVARDAGEATRRFSLAAAMGNESGAHELAEHIGPGCM
eukprot:m51a1_g3620 hypothetical protein (797) ;mRNA; f:86691-91215